MSSNILELLNDLIGDSKLRRDRAETKLVTENKLTEDDIKSISKWIIDSIFHAKEINEYLGYLTAFKVIMGYKEWVRSETVDKLSQCFLELQSHQDYRVRILAGDCMKVVCSIRGIPMFLVYLKAVRSGIEANMEEREVPDAALCVKLDSKQVFHDTAGWQALETWMKCYLSIIEGIGDAFESIVDEEIIDVTFRAMKHTNRFVRETGFHLIRTIVHHKGCSENDAIFLKTCEEVERGLCDNWSQVRYAASIAARALLRETGIMVDRHQYEVYSRMLGPLCLNRHYLAEGVRIFNIQTWRLQFGESGCPFLPQYMDHITQFLVNQFGADNHAVREAACGCISEIVCSGLGKSTVDPYFSRLYEALLNGFTDDCWPVRDGACLATAQLCTLFPEKCGAENGYNLEDPLFDLFMGNIMDSISSVRQGAARVTAELLGALPNDIALPFLKKCDQIITNALDNVKNQPAESKSASTLDKHSNSVFGIVKGSLSASDEEKANDGITKENEINDMARFSNQQMYSCGSLAPKMNKGNFSRVSKGGGCHDGKFQREAEPWEKADGCVLLASFLCLKTEYGREFIPRILNNAWDATRHKHYTHSPHLLSTIIGTIPHVFHSLGKIKFKTLLNIYLPMLEEAYKSDVVLTHSHATNIVDFLGQKLGPSILKGRIEMYCTLDFVDAINKVFDA